MPAAPAHHRQPLRGTRAPALVALTVIAVLAILASIAPFAHAQSSSARGWPAGMRQQLVGPVVVYLPIDRKAYVLGGRRVSPLASIPDVAVISLDSKFTINDPDSPAVQPAPFTLPDSGASSLIAVAAQRAGSFANVYDVWLLAGTGPGDADTTPKVWLVQDLIRATGVTPQSVKADPAGLRIMSPGRSAVVTPYPADSKDMAAYAMGNWSDVNSKMWRFDSSLSLAEVPVSSGESPAKRGFACAVQYGSQVLVSGGNNGSNTRLRDLWSFNLVAKTWSQTRAYALIMGYSSSPFLEYISLASAQEKPQAAIIDSTQSKGPESLSAHAMFVHDSHLFLVGGLPTSLLLAIKITPNNDGSLAFAWVTAYTPMASQTQVSSSTARAVDDMINKLSTPVIAGISVGAVAAAGIIILAAVLIWRRSKAKRAKVQDPNPDPALVAALAGPRAYHYSSTPHTDPNAAAAGGTPVVIGPKRPVSFPSIVGGTSDSSTIVTDMVPTDPRMWSTAGVASGPGAGVHPSTMASALNLPPMPAHSAAVAVDDHDDGMGDDRAPLYLPPVTTDRPGRAPTTWRASGGQGDVYMLPEATVARGLGSGGGGEGDGGNTPRV
ncbi:hypothetical protein AMAG_11392 [Allomyces macrogynus ATCC 38327]|uniref:Galactose oxidase n=1 Tax=Allomyces macrogynus (strain ATCC 38327) TaxID=578462 RepID=A0A0L0SWN0_ALLM3|nr:hypothetical protein AMAG_11392 [Allomyces macrogynus ATCC 38327]|eukprot:KNE66917.1 hypothetical protein AMAG_11392 [Allomyces macrogynus ATCC 38327]